MIISNDFPKDNTNQKLSLMKQLSKYSALEN